MNHEEQKKQYISVEKAGEELGVKRTTMYYYFQQLGIQTQKFALSRKRYITREDLERIREAKAAAGADER